MNFFKKIRNKVEHIRTGNKYKGCEICNRILHKHPQPVIHTFEKNEHDLVFLLTNHYVQVFFCMKCWNKLSVKEKIDYYLERANENQDIILTIKNICKESGVNPDKYIRKLKLEKIGI